MNRYRDASERLTFDFSEIKIKEYLKVTAQVVEAFNLQESGELVHGLDETFQSFKLNDYEISLEWDIWSGYIVIAENDASEALVKEIAGFIDSEAT